MSRKKIIVIGIFLITPFVLIAGALFAVYKNQKTITQKALTAINEQFVGELVIEDSYISPFANFPYISIDMRGLRFYENKEKNTKPLYEAADLYLGFDIIDILKGEYHVRSIKIEDGHLDVIKYENGDINLLLAKGITSDEEIEEEDGEVFDFDLKELLINKFDITYSNQSSQQDIIAHLDQLKSGFRLTEGHIFLDIFSKMVLDIDKNQENTFFNNKNLEIDLELDYDQITRIVSVAPSKLLLEESLFSLEGNMDMDDDYNMDLKLYGEKPDFNIFAAFAPAEIAETLKRYKNEGQIYFLGTIRGKMNATEMPSIAVEFGCENAYFVNTDMDKRVDDLRFTGFFTNGEERNLKTSELRLQNFYAKPEEGVFQGQLVIRDFEDPFIKINLNADMDLEFLGQFFEIDGLQRIKGQVILDMDFDELIDLEMPQEGLAQLKEGLDSELTIKNLSFLVPGYPHPIANANGHAVMENGAIQLDYLKFQIADSDFEFKGSLSDFPAVFHGFEKPIEAKLTATSTQINIPNLLSFDSALMAATDEVISDFEIKLAFETDADQLTGFEYFPKGNFYIEDLYAKLKNYPHIFHDFDADILISDEQLSIKDFTGEIDGSDFHFTGNFHNYAKWFQEVKRGDSRLEFDMVSNHLKINDLLSYNGENYLPDDYREEEIKELQLKGSLDLHYDSVLQSMDLEILHMEGLLKVHPLKLENFKGKIHLEGENTLVENFSGKMGESDFEIQMAYYSGQDRTLKRRDNYFVMKSRALDLDALMNYNAKDKEPVAHADTFNIFELPFTDMRFTVDIGKLNYHTYWLDDLHADIRITEDHYIHVDTLSLWTADGNLGMKGYFNGSDPESIYFNSNMVADRLDIDKLMIKFDNFGQDVMINENLHGKVSGTIQSNFLVHPDLTPIIEKSEAHMDLMVVGGSLVNFTPLEAVSSYFKDRNLKLVRFDTLQNTFDLKEGILHIPSMTINSSLGFIELSGRQSLDLNMDYFIRIPLGLVTQVGFRSLFGGKNREEVDPDQEDEIVYRDENRRVRFLNISMSGTPDDYKVSLGRDKGN